MRSKDKRYDEHAKGRKKTMFAFILAGGMILAAAAILFVMGMQEERNSTTEGVKENTKEEATQHSDEMKENEEAPPIEEEKEKPKDVRTSITISAAGDFTIGTDESFGYTGSFVEEADKNGLGHFVGGLNNIFAEDDLTTVNLETTFTKATQKADKKFRFKGDPSYVKILEMAGIEAVNLANNHIHDYLQQGYEDTITTLKNGQIGYFGYEHKYLKAVKGVNIGAVGYEGWRDDADTRAEVSEGIRSLKDQGAQIVVVHFHWGVERQYVPLESQRSLAKFAIDSGADLIIGHHPHVVQGIEEYKDKFIVYSMGNFMFGGNRNPSDKDTFVFQQTFHLVNGTLTNEKEIQVVPFSISSLPNRNDYQPTLLTGQEAARVKNKIIDVSNQISGSDWLVYEKNGESAKAE